MKLGDVLDCLVSSELANLNFVVDGEIVQEKIPKIVNAINLGLVKLYTRFKLKKGILVLRVSQNVSEYLLTASNVMTLSNPYGFIESPNYSGDLIEILYITSSTGSSVAYDGSDSVVLLQPNLIKYKTPPTSTEYLTIEYSALPRKVVYTQSVDIDVELPEVYLHALLMFIGSRFASPVGISFDANRNSMDMNYLQQYEAECQRLESFGLDVGNEMSVNLFSARGFV